MELKAAVAIVTGGNGGLRQRMDKGGHKGVIYLMHGFPYHGDGMD